MNVIINPGTGPAPEATAELAQLAINQFVCETFAAELKTVIIRPVPRRNYGDGRYAFLLRNPDMPRPRAVVEVQMPGLPLDRVRCTEDDNPWHYPRVYVDGNSWIWHIGVDIARRALTGRGEE